VAEFLGEQGKEVTIIETLHEIARDMPQIAKIPLTYALENNGVQILTNASVLTITQKGAWIKHGKKERLIPVDTIVFSVGSEPNYESDTVVRTKVPVVYTIGDREKPRGILEAIRDGFNIGKLI